jgi:hypothetical protein
MLSNELRAMEVKVGIVQSNMVNREEPHLISHNGWRTSLQVRGFGGKLLRYVIQLRMNEEGRLVTERWTEN